MCGVCGAVCLWGVRPRCIVCIREVHVCGMYVCGVYTWRDVVCVWPCLWYVRGGACMCVCGMSVRPPGPKEP